MVKYLSVKNLENCSVFLIINLLFHFLIQSTDFTVMRGCVPAKKENVNCTKSFDLLYNSECKHQCCSLNY